jgi:hypothetical protein
MPEKPSEEEVARVRTRGREILDSLRNDPAFADQVRKDPTGALVARGIPEAAVLEWCKAGADVSGYDDENCVFTCIYSTDNTGCFATVTY